MFLCASSVRAQDLPPGSYIYLGTNPGRDRPKLFDVDSHGRIQWQGSRSGETVVNRANQQKTADKQGASKVSETQSAIELYAYPEIKFKLKPVSSLPGAAVQLETTSAKLPYAGETIRFKLTIVNASRMPSQIAVQLLDHSGFKLIQHIFYAQDFRVIPGTQLIEARGDRYDNSNTYKDVRDFVAN